MMEGSRQFCLMQGLQIKTGGLFKKTCILCLSTQVTVCTVTAYCIKEDTQSKYLSFVSLNCIYQFTTKMDSE